MEYNFDCDWIQTAIDMVKSIVGNSKGMLFVFPQMWGSSAMGYGGVGLSAMTAGTTVAIVTDDTAYVFLGRPQLAYTIKNPTDEFWKDLNNKSLYPAYAVDAVKLYGDTSF